MAGDGCQDGKEAGASIGKFVFEEVGEGPPFCFVSVPIPSGFVRVVRRGRV